jgi:hypothetical protein
MPCIHEAGSADYLKSLNAMALRLAALQVAARQLNEKVQVLFGLVFQNEA